MDKQYKKLMDQQDIDADVTARLFETLEKTTPRRKSVRWGAAIAAACMALMIPLTVAAVESFFAVPKVKLGKLDWYDGSDGYSIRFENLDSFPLNAFPAEVQTLAEHKIVPCDSWEAAEETLGIDLLNNAFLTEACADTVEFDDEGDTHSKILYAQQDGKLFFIGTTAYYQYEDLNLEMKAKIAVEHPEMDEETKQIVLGDEGVTVEPADAETSFENYSTKEGIPVVIHRRDLDQVIYYRAFFAVNDISYEVTAWISPDREEAEKQILLEALDGFKLP